MALRELVKSLRLPKLQHRAPMWPRGPRAGQITTIQLLATCLSPRICRVETGAVVLRLWLQLRRLRGLLEAPITMWHLQRCPRRSAKIYPGPVSSILWWRCRLDSSSLTRPRSLLPKCDALSIFWTSTSGTMQSELISRYVSSFWHWKYGWWFL